jgi:hypothetical protein
VANSNVKVTGLFDDSERSSQGKCVGGQRIETGGQMGERSDHWA